MRVLKHGLPKNPTTLRLPVDARFLTFGSVAERTGPGHYVWTEEPTDKRAATTVWVIWTVMTGDNVPPEALLHLGSHIGGDGVGQPYVTHYYGTEAA